MDNSADGHARPRSARLAARGFTLVEIMVVLVILGLVAGLVGSISMPDDRAKLRLETERLAQLLDLAATESRLSGKRIAWTGEKSGYRFWRFAADTEWQEIRDVDSLRPRTLPPGIQIASFSLENSLPREAMRLEFASSGSALAFVIEMTSGAARYSVQGSPIGDLKILPDDRNPNGAMAPQ
jgi:general secretion pathway protein H